MNERSVLSNCRYEYSTITEYPSKWPPPPALTQSHLVTHNQINSLDESEHGSHIDLTTADKPSPESSHLINSQVAYDEA